MDFKYLPSLAFLMLLVATEAADLASSSVPPEMYWNSMLPNVPMPPPIRDIVNLGEQNRERLSKQSGNQGDKAYFNPIVDLPDLNDEEDRTLFFMEQELLPGKTMRFQFINRTNEATFLPRKLAESSPFSLDMLPYAYNQFSIIAASPEGSIMRRALQKCHAVSLKGWKNETCVTSLESMVDLVTTVLGKNVQAFSSEVKKEDAQIRQFYKSNGVEKIEASKFLACHKLNYPLGLFYCHTFDSHEAYGVRVHLKGSNGADVVGVGVCHIKTNEWEAYIARTPNRMAAVREGRVSLCHILAGDTTVWTAKETSTM